MWKPSITPSDVLMHHGIEGQKWGKRNGPPYPLSSSQKSSSERKYRTDKGYKKNKNQSSGKKKNKNQSSGKKKKASQMSNKELRYQIERKQLEQRYDELNTSQISKGRQKVMNLIRDYAVVAGAVATTAGIVKTVYQIKNGKFGN